jgi:hypothetical protein
MERRNTMRRNLLIALLLLLPTLPALAGQAESSIFSPSAGLIKLAQLSPSERREARERWERASPEERIRMRQFFQDRLGQLPVPAQEAIRIPFPDMAPRDDAREPDAYAPADSRFGFGFERRRTEEARPDRSVGPGNRRPRDDARR